MWLVKLDVLVGARMELEVIRTPVEMSMDELATVVREAYTKHPEVHEHLREAMALKHLSPAAQVDAGALSSFLSVANFARPLTPPPSSTSLQPPD